MKPILLEHLRCPDCSGCAPALSIASAEYRNDEIFSGELICGQGHSFKIEDYILDLIGSDNQRTDKASNIYNSIWNAQPQQLYQGRISEYIKKFQSFANLPEPLEVYFKNKIILDAGCGQGRFSYLASSLGASCVIALDYSKGALQRAIAATGNPLNCSFIRANILKPPLLEEFDFVFSLGVLHHTAHTQDSYRAIAGLLKPGGFITIYVYGKYTLPLIIWPLRPLTLKMDKEHIIRFCNDCGFGYDAALIPKIPLQKIFSKLGRLDILGLNRVTSEELTTRYIREHSLKDIKDWFEETEIEMVSSTNIVSASGRHKPESIKHFGKERG